MGKIRVKFWNTIVAAVQYGRRAIPNKIIKKHKTTTITE